MFTIASFEFRSRLRLLSTWVYFLIFFALSMLWMASAGGLFKEANVSFGSGKVFINSPFAISETVSLLGMFGLTVIAAISGRAVQQDFEYRSQTFFFTAPITKLQYLGGRFLGSLGVSLVVFAGIGLGAFLATYIPGMDATRIGPNRLSAYLVPYLFILVPNTLLIGGAFFSLAAMTRRMLPVYLGSVLAIIGWLLSSRLIRDLDNKTVAALLDPFGARAVSIVTEYWTVSERNTRALPLGGVLLWNRLLWSGVAALICGLCYWRFSFATFAQEPVARGKKARRSDEDLPVSPVHVPVVQTPPGRQRPAWFMLPGLVGLYFRETVKNIYFGVLVLAGLLFMIIASTTMGDIFGTSTWPVTREMLGLLSGTFSLFMLIIIAFYGGELVWRERDCRIDQISDATPIPTWVPMAAKLLALMLVPVMLQAVLLVCGMGIQISKGYTHFQIGLYLHDMFGIRLIDYWLLCALAITVHSVINQKYMGHFVMTLYYVLLTFSSQLGLEHNLYKFGNYPEAVYSDMNGYGHFLYRARVFQAYWTAGAIVLLVLGYLMWTRGTVSGAAERLKVARARLSRPTLALGGLGLVGFVALGGFIYWNTNILNRYQNTYDGQLRRADYEKKYKRLAAEPQPKVIAVQVDLDLYPQKQDARMRGSYTLQNRSGVPVSTLNLVMPPDPTLKVHKMELAVPSSLVEDDQRLFVRRYALTPPLPPGAETRLTFDIELTTPGFTNEGSNTAVVYNGTFLNGRAMLPSLGYVEAGELERDQDRRKFGLEPKERMRDRDDPAGLQRNDLAADSDWIRFEANISTEADQIAISPGYLQKEWVEGDRHHYSYKMDVPILNFFAFQSARYAVRRDVWHDAPGNRDVRLEVYYQPGHEFNIDGMLTASKAALEYLSTNFGAFQYQQFRILEFPRYETFAQSFPNTIPYSEGIGFIARVRPNDEKDIDYPYYVTAHEAAHQWWGYQVVSAEVQGATLLIESLSQYSALMVMKHKYGESKMRKFLAYELNRYLTGRAFEQKKELPLGRVENQTYIHYAKGSLVMYALQDYIGEDKVNAALRSLRDATAYKGPPYPNATQLIAALRKVTPPELAYLIDDMFEHIVLYDNRAVSARAKKLPDGRYEVAIKVKAKKFQADALGKEDEVPLADYIDIGTVDDNGNQLELRREKITQEDSSFTLTVAQKPAKAGIDPLNKLIDRRPKDNTIPIELD